MVCENCGSILDAADAYCGGVNRCRHRGATVCEHKKGKTNSFVCPYHGWSYALDGSLRGVPHPESYADCLDKAELPLVSLRVEQYNGMIFATFLGLLLIPVFFIVVRRMLGDKLDEPSREYLEHKNQPAPR